MKSEKELLDEYSRGKIEISAVLDQFDRKFSKRILVEMGPPHLEDVEELYDQRLDNVSLEEVRDQMGQDFEEKYVQSGKRLFWLDLGLYRKAYEAGNLGALIRAARLMIFTLMLSPRQQGVGIQDTLIPVPYWVVSSLRQEFEEKVSPKPKPTVHHRPPLDKIQQFKKDLQDFERYQCVNRCLYEGFSTSGSKDRPSAFRKAEKLLRGSPHHTSSIKAIKDSYYRVFNTGRDYHRYEVVEQCISEGFPTSASKDKPNAFQKAEELLRNTPYHDRKLKGKGIKDSYERVRNNVEEYHFLRYSQ